MKTILITALMLVGFSIQSQDSIARLNHVTEYDIPYSSWTVNFTYEYQYDIYDRLKSMRIKLPNGSIHLIQYYRNDTMYKTSSTTNYIYTYTSDTVYRWHLDDGDTVASGNFDVSEENEWLLGGDFVWYEGNCVAWKDALIVSYQEFRNPYVHTWKHLKRADEWGHPYDNGSYNLSDTFYYANGDEYEWIVTDSIGKWPTEFIVKYNGVDFRKYEIEYRDWVPFYLTDVPELSSEPSIVLSVNYYDMMGRKMPKPKEGFYIERMVTNKGVVSTKHYIQ